MPSKGTVLPLNDAPIALKRDPGYHVLMDLKKIRELCKKRFEDRNSNLNPDDRETLSLCTACEGLGLLNLAPPPRRMDILCPFCDGFGFNDSYMKKMYAKYWAEKTRNG